MSIMATAGLHERPQEPDPALPIPLTKRGIGRVKAIILDKSFQYLFGRFQHLEPAA